MNRVSIVCLGVRNMEASVRFYRDGLGFVTDVKENNPHMVFFNTYGTKLELYPLQELAEDINSVNPPSIGKGFSGITLAYNVDSKEKVNEVIELVRSAGGTVVKEPQEVFWGGFHAYFSDPDGYYWEVAYGPDFKYDEHGMLTF
ncbi:VOC family protein [Gorillibacterium massiliense]|uniref:VOC family protein n=1 Tax=Gorillibacterium massiliense TaxID=1280390 RepID=UPI000592EFE7|nr:VOC family protein [Gorillibacterium massiliense]